MELTQSVLKELLNYDPLTGVFTWKERSNEWFETLHHAKTWNTRFAGKEAFTRLDAKGYKRGTILRKTYRIHRVAWLYMVGEWPTHEIDHKDNDRANNRWDNLRDLPKPINLRRRKAYGLTGIKGVSINSAGNYRVKITVNGKTTALGTYPTLEQARQKRLEAELLLGVHET